MCGEHSASIMRSRFSLGSSPRVRGTLESLGVAASHGGIIPACAGNTPALRTRHTMTRDHPRVCGEHEHATGVVSWFEGSSPRVRGTRHLRGHRAPVAGIIPACAGNTPVRLSPAGSPWDHPRVCGEHASHGKEKGMDWGSSPRVRGTPLVPGIAGNRRGIIPACAGNTPGCCSPPGHSRDHPRVCGEHPPLSILSTEPLGSSPRVRGTRACETWSARSGRDHPRVCGEHGSMPL